MDDRGRNGGTNFILRIKEQETRLSLQEHDDDDEDDGDDDDDDDCEVQLVGLYESCKDETYLLHKDSVRTAL